MAEQYYKDIFMPLLNNNRLEFNLLDEEQLFVFLRLIIKFQARSK